MTVQPPRLSGVGEVTHSVHGGPAGGSASMDGVSKARCVDRQTEAWAPSALIWRVTMDPEFAGVNFLSPSFEKQST